METAFKMIDRVDDGMLLIYSLEWKWRHCYWWIERNLQIQ